MQVLLYVAAALAYGSAAFAFGAERGSTLERRATLLLVVAGCTHLAFIGSQCVDGNHPLASVHLAASLGALLTVAGFSTLVRRGGLAGLGPLVAALGLVGATIGVLFGTGPDHDHGGAQLVGRLHVLLATAGVAGFALAAGVAGLYLGLEQRLRRKIFRPGEGTSLLGLDRLHHRIVLAVTPIFTLAIVTGVLWALRTEGTAAWSGRIFEIAAAGIAWLASLLLLAARAAYGMRGRRSAALTLLALVAVLSVLLYYGLRGGAPA
jgi:ABC-type uncharacterized transport system permease subunit